MKIQQLIKKVNNTELGKTGIHETYIHIPKELDLGSFFDSPGASLDFRDRSSGQTFPLRYTEGREQRIVGLGKYYRCHDINAGDEILLERKDIHGIVLYEIDMKKNNNKIVFQKHSKGFEALNHERLDDLLNGGETSLLVSYGESLGMLDIKHSVTAKKRNDSPNETDFYELIYDGESIENNLKNKEFIELIMLDEINLLQKMSVWESITITKQEDE